MPSTMAMSSLQHAHSAYRIQNQSRYNFTRLTNVPNLQLRRYPSHNPHRKVIITTAARDDGDIEVAVFRFTLGIPGFDDALIPRVVGILGAFLLLANHIVSPQPVPEPQTRIEIIGTVLAAVGIAAPSLQKRLEELRPGKGRRAMAENVPGGTNVFALDTQQLPENAQQDVAWSSYALLKNANTCGIFVVYKGQVLMCRGILGSSIAGEQGPEVVLQRATDAWASISGEIFSSGGGNGGGGGRLSPIVLEDRGSMNRIPGLDICKVIPSGANSVAIIPMQPLLELEDEKTGNSSGGTGNSENHYLDSMVVLVSERERALSTKEVRWAQGVAAKLYSTLSSS